MNEIRMAVRHEVKALATGRRLDFYITDEIKADGSRWNWQTGEQERVESNTSQRYFVENLKDCQPGDTVNLYINSLGGSVKEALGIYNVLKRCPATVTAYIDGFAASAASVMAVAAEKVVMPRNTTMMVHNAWNVVAGNAKELRKAADDLDVINGAMLQSYITKAGDKLTEEKLQELTDGETWLSAEDCILYGLADEYAEEDADLQAAAAQYRAQYQTPGAATWGRGKVTMPAAMAAAIAAAEGNASTTAVVAPVPAVTPQATKHTPPAAEPGEPEENGLEDLMAVFIN